MHFLQTVPVLYDMDMVISSFVNVSETFAADTCEHTAAASLRPRFTFFMNIFKCFDLLIKKYIFCIKILCLAHLLLQIRVNILLWRV